MTATAAIKAPKDIYEYTMPNSGYSKKNNLFVLTPNSEKTFWKSKRTPLTKNYAFNGSSLGDIPNDLSYLLEEIEKSKYILDLQDDWDDEGSEGYKELSWAASIRFLLKYAKTLYQDFNIEVQTPNIYPGPKGSIDILWKVETYRLMVNIGKNGEDAMFYADNHKDQISEGNFKIDQFNRFLLPIAIKS